MSTHPSYFRQPIQALPPHQQPHRGGPPVGGGAGGGGTPRRGPGPMVNPNAAAHGQGIPAQHQLAYQQQNAANAHEREMAKRRSREPTDMNLPEEVEKLVPNGELYRKLRDFERRLDAAIIRKRLDMDDVVKRFVKNEKILRIWISNTAKDQPWQNMDQPLDENTFDFNMDNIPTFRVRIEGRLLDDDEDEESVSKPTKPDAPASESGATAAQPSSTATPAKPARTKRKFSSFFKSMVVEFDRDKEQYPEGNTIEWERPAPAPNAAPFKEVDAFEFERKGDANVACTVKLQMFEIPERYKLSKPLADLLDTKEDTPSGIVMALWEYVRVNGLQNPEDKRYVICNEPLKNIFGQERLFFPHISEATKSHIFPPDPITLNYTIRVDVASHTSPYVYDLVVPVDDPIRQKMQETLQSRSYASGLQECLSLDKRIAVIIQQINRSKAKYDFWKSMSLDPAGFVGRWVASQKRDLEVILGEGDVDDEEVRRAEFFERMGENVHLLLKNGLTREMHRKQQEAVAAGGVPPPQ